MIIMDMYLPSSIAFTIPPLSNRNLVATLCIFLAEWSLVRTCVLR